MVPVWSQYRYFINLVFPTVYRVGPSGPTIFGKNFIFFLLPRNVHVLRDDNYLHIFYGFIVGPLGPPLLSVRLEWDLYWDQTGARVGPRVFFMVILLFLNFTISPFPQFTVPMSVTFKIVRSQNLHNSVLVKLCPAFSWYF